MLLQGCAGVAHPSGERGLRGYATLEWEASGPADGARLIHFGRCEVYERTKSDLLAPEPGVAKVRLVPGSGTCLVFTTNQLHSHEVPGDDIERWAVVIDWERGSLAELLAQSQDLEATVLLARAYHEPPDIGHRKEGVRFKARRERDGIVLSGSFELSPPGYFVKSVTLMCKVLDQEQRSRLFVR